METDTQNKNLSLLAAMLGVIAMAGFLLVFVAPTVYKKGQALITHPQVDQTFYVATMGGEAFEVKAMHECGEANMRRAAVRATHFQDERISPDFYKFLVAITMDYARIYEGNVLKNRCEITGVTFTNITGKAYIVEETK